MNERQKKLTSFLAEARRLHEEHGRILEALERSQKDAAFYQSQYRKAQQIEHALKKGYAPTPSFRPDFLEDKKYLEAIRQLIVQSVFARWNQSREPSTLRQVYNDVRDRIDDLIKTGRWNTKRWKPPGKRTIDRRVNECADPKFYEGETPLIALKPGVYMPNPRLFKPPFPRIGKRKR